MINRLVAKLLFVALLLIGAPRVAAQSAGDVEDLLISAVNSEPADSLNKDSIEGGTSAFVLGPNRLEFPGSDASMARFFAKLQRLKATGKGTINVVHIGGSHVQGGTLTHQLRKHLLAFSPDSMGGFGMVFPYKAARTNTPSGYRSACTGKWTVSRSLSQSPDERLGLTGIAVTTRDSAATVSLRISSLRDLSGRYDFSSLRLLGRASSPDVVPVVMVDSVTRVTGDYVASEGCYRFNLPEATRGISIAFEGLDSLQQNWFTITGVLFETNHPGITTHGIGVNGASLACYQRCPDLVRDLGMVKPDLVVCAVGINDAVPKNFSKDNFIDNYAWLVKQVRRVNPDCAFIFVSNNDSYRRSTVTTTSTVRSKSKKGKRRRRTVTRKKVVYTPNSNGAVASDAFRIIAKNSGGAFWDLFHIMGGLGSMRAWERKGLAQRDKVHFTDAGYLLVADMLYEALLDSYGDYEAGHPLKR